MGDNTLGQRGNDQDTCIGPSYNRVPLVQAERKIAVGPDPFGVVGVHDCFRSRTDSNRHLF